MTFTVLALLVALAGLLATALWFGVNQRRKAESELGIQTLANMKWRDCIAVLLEALEPDGYQQLPDSMAAGDGGTEVLLLQGGQKVLLGYKHGTAYRLGESSVREFANALRLRGAGAGILLTLGSAEPSARHAAETSRIQLIDGSELWPKVRQFIPPGMLDVVRRQAAAGSRKGLRVGGISSVLAGVAIYLLGNTLGGNTPIISDVADSQATPVARVESAAVGRPRSDAAMLKQLNATAQAMAAVAKLTPEELAGRRAEAVRNVSQIAQVDSAAWSAQRTLSLNLNKTDGKDKVLIDEVCRILTRQEEMRFTRIQLNPPNGSNLTVRWRLCG